MIGKIFAHAGEKHESVVESTQHAVSSDNVVLIAVILAFLILVPLIFKNKMPKSNVPMIVLMAELFLVGIFTYSVSPIISILSLSVGFMLAFFFVMLGLSAND